MRKLFLLIAGSLLFFCEGQAQTLPQGFTTSIIGSGWNLPMGTLFSDDGQKLFVWEKDGRLYVCKRNASGNYIKQSTPVLDISEEVANWGDHGLMGFALDPNYLSNGLIYLLYVVDRHHLLNFGTPNYNPATSSSGATIGRITRYKTVTSGSNLVTDLASRMILLGETKTTGIAVTHDGHGMGTLAFAADGTLLATCGEGASYYTVDKGSDSDTDFQQALADGILRPEENVGAFRAQMLNSHNGKLLRIDPVTGNGVSSNPYYSAAQPRSPKSRVWAFGLRNPFRISVKPGTGSTNPAAGDVGEIYIGDVGWNAYEEVNVITTPGVNCGWPLFEGLTPTPGYTEALTANRDEPNPLFGINGCTKQFFDFQDLIRQATADNNKTVHNPCNPAQPIGTGDRFYHQRPIIDWKHFTDSARVGIFSGNDAAIAQIGSPESNVIGSPFPGNCALGGPWYSGSSFPAEYSNRYFVADHDAKWIRCVTVDFTDVVTEVKTFGTGFLGTVCITMNPLDGSLIVVELGNFSTIGPSIKQIRFGGNQSPVVTMSSDKKYGPSALAVNFTGINSFDPDGNISEYEWNFGDGTTSTLANPTHSFTAPANTPTKYAVKLTVTDNEGASSTDSIIISVNNTPPVVNITNPVKNSLYEIGPDALYACTATVSDAEHTPGQLIYEWQTFLRHNNHAHPQPISNEISPDVNISRIGCNGDTYYWLIQLTVTDAAGLSAVDSSKIFPDCNVGPDITPPTVSSVFPVNGATGVPTGTTVTAIFNEAMDPATITGTTFQLKDAGNQAVPATLNKLSNQFTLTPTAVLDGSTIYTATIKGGASGVKDAAGNALVNDYSWSFTTAAVDNIAPEVTTVSPVNGAADVSTATTVIANFSEAINAATVNGTTVQLVNAANDVIAASLNTSANQVVLTPSAALTGSTVYTVTIKSGASGVKDLAGNALVNDFNWSFTTETGDIIPPVVSSVVPATGDTGINIYTTVTANFNEVINASTVSGSTFQLRDAGNNLVAATVSTSSDQFILTPAAALTISTTYTVTIIGGASGVKDLAGNALVSDYSWSFTTGTEISPPPVSILSFTAKTGIAATAHSLTGVPAGALLVLATTSDAVPSNCSVSSSPSLEWIKRVDAGAAQSDNAEIWTAVYPAGGSITVTSNWGGDNSQSSVCYVVLHAEPALGGAFGTAVLQPAPSVTITTTKEKSIIFGCTADWKAVDGATRTLRDDATERLYFKDGHYTTYHYTKMAASIAAYTEGVSFPTGQQASTALLEIRGSLVDTDNTPPLVLSASPLNETTGVSVSTAVTANFNEAIDMTTVTTATFQLKDADNNIVPASISMATNQVILTPSGALENSTVYTATITGGASGVKDIAGNALVNNYSWSFTTVAEETSLPPVTILSFTTKTGTAATAHSLTGVPAGALLVLATTSDAVPSDCSISSSPSLTWTKQVDAGAASSDNAEIWTAVYSAGGSITVISNWGAVSQASVCYIVLNAETSPAGATATGVLQSAPSVTITTTRNNSMIFGCTADWKALNGTTRTLRDSATERLYFKDGNFTTYHYTKAAASMAGYTEGVSFPTGQQASTALLEIRSAVILPVVTTQPASETKCAGVIASFTSSASGSPAPTVQWQESTNGTTWADITGATGSTLSFVADVADNNKQYRAVWTNSGGTTNTDPATITVTAIPQFLDGLATTATSNEIFTLNAASTVAGTSFAWSRAVVPGISNASANGTGSVSETLINTTNSPVNVTYVYTLTAAGCTNTQNVVVTVNPAAIVNNCTIDNTSLTSNFNSAAIPAGRYIWFNSSLDPGSLGAGTDPVTINITNGVISFTANNVNYNLNVPNARIRFDASVTTASTQFINNVWETVVPRNYTSDVFMSGLSYLVPVDFPGNYTNVKWTTNISVDKEGVSVGWRWAAAVYTSFADHSDLNVKPINGSTQNPYANLDRAGTPEDYRLFVVNGAKGTGGTNYTGSFSPVNTATCTANQIPATPVVCTISNSTLGSNFSGTAIPAGRYIWFNSSLDPGSLGTGTDPVTMYITEGVISFTENNVQYNLNVPNARIRFDASVTSASTQFINNVWETVVPRNYTSDIFMGGLSYLVPVDFPGNYMNVNWTTNISMDKPGISVGWRWAAAVYTTFADHAALDVKPVNGSTQNPYANLDRAGAPENLKSFVVDGAKGTGGSNYTGSFSSISTATCLPNTGQRSLQQPVVRHNPVSSIEEVVNDKLKIETMPNPSNTYFNLVIKSNNDNPATIRITDMFGRVVERHEKISANTVVQIGGKLRSGSYFVEVIQADQRRFAKIIKVN